MATIARFQGGPLNGKDVDLDEALPVQSYIETAADHGAPTPTYKRAATGYQGATQIIIYRLEGPQ